MTDVHPAEVGTGAPVTGFADHWEHLRAEFAVLDLALEAVTARDAGESASDALDELRAGIDARVAATARRTRLPLARLTAAAGLTPWEVTLLVLCLGVELDARYGRWCAATQGDPARDRPGPRLALDLLGGGFPERASGLLGLRPDAPLRGCGLLRVVPGSHGGPAELLALTDVALELLAGRPHGPDRPWLRRLSPGPAAASPDEPVEVLLRAAGQILAGGTWGPVRPDPSGPIRGGWASGGDRLVACLHGVPAARALDLAHQVASGLGIGTLVVDLTEVRAAGGAAADAVREAALEARAAPALLALALPGPEPAGHEAAPEAVLLEIAPVLDRAGWITVLASAQPVTAPPTAAWVSLDVPPSDVAGLARRWTTELQAAGVPVDEPAASSLASRFRAGVAGIAPVVAAAVRTARLHGRPPVLADVELAARDGSGPGLGPAARRIRSRRDWGELVLPPAQTAQLHELVAAVASRRTVLADWGFGAGSSRGTGIAALFSGPPGTGKTLAAEIVAARLGLDLFVVDLAAAVSKYIGETEKNLGRVFDAAASTDGLLFFDEADALFGRRSEVKDAHDRYANIEISYLLGRIEAHDGLVVLATNLERHLDEAFLRRLAFAVRFAPPGPADRARIWQVQLPAAAPVEPDVDWDLLASFPLTGGHIRGAVLHAAYQSAALGRPIGTVSLLAGLRRELEKVGRVPAAADFGPYWQRVQRFGAAP